MRHEAEKLNWYSNDDLETPWNHLKYNILNLMDKHIPKTKLNQRNKKKRPNYMTKKSCREGEGQEKSFQQMKRN